MIKVIINFLSVQKGNAKYARFWEYESAFRDILLDRLHVNEGMLMENIVAQELRAHGHKLYFYSLIDTNNRENNMDIKMFGGQNIEHQLHAAENRGI